MNKNNDPKTRLIDTARHLFYVQGYNATGINQIIAESNVAIGTLYKHFSSKKELLYVCIDEQDSRWFKELDHFLSLVEGGARQKLLGIFDFRIQWGTTADYRGCPFLKISAEVAKEEEVVFKKVAQHKKKLFEYIQSFVGQLPAKSGQSSPSNLAESLFYLIEGAGVSNLINQNNTALTVAREIAAQMI